MSETCFECGAPATVDRHTYPTPLGPRPVVRFDRARVIRDAVDALSDEDLETFAVQFRDVWSPMRPRALRAALREALLNQRKEGA